MISILFGFWTVAGKSPSQQVIQSEIQRPTCQDQLTATGSPVPHAALGRTTVWHRGDTQQGKKGEGGRVGNVTPELIVALFN